MLLIVLWLVGALVVGFIAMAAITQHLGWAILALASSPLIALLTLVAVTVVAQRPPALQSIRLQGRSSRGPDADR